VLLLEHLKKAVGSQTLCKEATIEICSSSYSVKAHNVCTSTLQGSLATHGHTNGY